VRPHLPRPLRGRGQLLRGGRRGRPGVAALDAKAIPHAYLPFPGEQHGFRQAAHIRRALEAELYFYSRVFGFALADPVDPVPIANL
jgi:hypothetical protein